MDAVSILERFDAELRNDPPPEVGTRFEAVGGVVRAVGDYAWIIYAKLSEAGTDRAIADEVAYFTSRGREVEWKVYGHDRPRDLGARLAAHGFEADETETLMVFDLGSDMPPPVPHPAIEIRRVRDDAGLNDLIAVSAEAFGRDPSRIAALCRDRLHDPTLGLFVAYASGEPAAAGRLEMPPGRSFAGLWGSGTKPAFRGRGIYHALVAARAREAKRLGLPVSQHRRTGHQPANSRTAWVRPGDHDHRLDPATAVDRSAARTFV